MQTNIAAQHDLLQSIDLRPDSADDQGSHSDRGLVEPHDFVVMRARLQGARRPKIDMDLLERAAPGRQTG